MKLLIFLEIENLLYVYLKNAGYKRIIDKFNLTNY